METRVPVGLVLAVSNVLQVSVPGCQCLDSALVLSSVSC